MKRGMMSVAVVSLTLLVAIGAVYKKSICVTLAPGDPRRGVACDMSGCYTQATYCHSSFAGSFDATPGTYKTCQSAPYTVYECVTDDDPDLLMTCVTKTYYAGGGCLTPLTPACTVAIKQQYCTTVY